MLPVPGAIYEVKLTKKKIKETSIAKGVSISLSTDRVKGQSLVEIIN